MKPLDDTNDELNELIMASSPKEIVPGVWVRRIREILDESHEFLRFEEPPREEIAIVIWEGTTIEDIRNAWFDICVERGKLHNTQGTDLEASNKDLLQELHESKSKGSSYADLAHDLNFDSALFLLGIFYNAIIPKILDNYEIKGLSAKTLLVSQAGFYRILDFMALEQADWIEWVKDGEENIRAGKAPWSPYNGPVTRYMVINKLRQYQKDLSNYKIIVKESPIENRTNYSLNICYKENFYQAFMKMLQKSYPKDYEKYKNRMKIRMVIALSEMEPFGPV